MPRAVRLPDPCAFCGAEDAERHVDGLRCARCHWRVGDVPDSGLERPRVEVVYYLRYTDRIKIGTSAHPRQRLGAIRHEQLLAFEQGGRGRERQRHDEFAALRQGGEWFRAAPELLEHIDRLDCPDPWLSYTRWVSAALRRIV